MQATESGPSILTVSELTHSLKQYIESAFRHVWLQGEISNLTKHTSGHLYFSLKDAGSQISAVMFRADAIQLKFGVKEGAQVIVRGDLNVYAPSGKYQIVVKEMRLVGLGELLLQLEELKRKLHGLGWFDAAKKKELPRFPKRIGIVTSPTGAAIQDILNVLSRRFSGFRVLLNPVKVQGIGSAAEIAEAIRQFNEYDLVDVIIIGRGGGSIEDLWAFNEEIVAEAIYASRIPIISAVGHETDICLSDYVADVRAPTPSAAAMLVIAEKEQQVEFLAQTKRRLSQAMKTQLQSYKQKMEHLIKQPMLTSPYALLGMWMQRSDDLRMQIDLAISRKLQHVQVQMNGAKQRALALQPTVRLMHLRGNLEEWKRSISFAMNGHLGKKHIDIENANGKLNFIWEAHHAMRRRQFVAEQKQKQLELTWQRLLSLLKERCATLASSLRALNPKNVLEKGYAIVLDRNSGVPLKSIAMVSENLQIQVAMSDGEFSATLKDVAISG